MIVLKWILLGSICFSCIAHASNVKWGTGTIEAETGPYPGNVYLHWSFSANDELHVSLANFYFAKMEYNHGANLVSADYALAAYGSAFAIMSEGDVVNAVSMATGNLFSDPYGLANGNKVYGQTISITTETSIYLGFSTDVSLLDGSFEVRQGYGWTKIGLDSSGNVVAESAAIDLDGGPMIVGGGSAIPEPSSAMLLLLGCSLLALSRKKL